MDPSRLKEALGGLCRDNGWSYGVFWRFDRGSNSGGSLSMEENYCEAHIGMVIKKMLNHVHMVGDGFILGGTSSGKYRWINSDDYSKDWSFINPIDNADMLENPAEWNHQFAAGIKTIVIISMLPFGVVQFGSTQKIRESLEFVDQVKQSFQNTALFVPSSSGNTPRSFLDIYDRHGTFASIIPYGNSYTSFANIKSLPSQDFKDLSAEAQPSACLAQSSSLFTHGSFSHFFIPEIPYSTHSAKSFGNASQALASYLPSFPLTNQCQNASVKAQVILSTPNLQGQQVRSRTTLSSKSSVVSNNNMHIWGTEPTLSSMDGQLFSELGTLESSSLFSTNSLFSIARENSLPKFQGNSSTPQPHISSAFLDTTSPTGSFLDIGKSDIYGLEKMVDIQNTPLFHAVEGDLSFDGSYPKDSLFLSEHPKQSVDFITSPGDFRSEHCTLRTHDSNPVPEPTKDDLTAIVSDTVSHTPGVMAISSDFIRCNGNNRTTSSGELQNPIDTFGTCTRNSLGTSSDGKENALDVPMEIEADKDLFDGLELDFRKDEVRQCWDDNMMVVGSSNCLNLTTSVSECISELDVNSMADRDKGLFSEFGLEQLLDAVVGNINSATDHNHSLASDQKIQNATADQHSGDQFSTTTYSSQIPLVSLPCFSNIDHFLSGCNPANAIHASQKDVLKSHVSSWIDDNYSINAENAVIMQPKRSEEPAKVTRKRARPGESTRPRPKDRQQIQDRVKELREIVPNGAKCSIDALLDRTIKHMLFLQSVAKYADKLKQTDEPKMIGEESGVVLKDNSNGSGGGATWAFEVGGQTMVCPILVEDLNPPGQMLVEMLCEERGFFLEIADIIRGFGLTILKGIMEVRDDKIWARFLVEAHREVTRMDIFLSLVQLLQQTASGAAFNGLPTKATDTFPNYQPPPMQHSISLADRLQ
ncbi:Transcription factor LHW [Acorus gramineus]|uniref:Transcription factor LHW n=1 Tax=Acorus gramineus TaxID=55184 RepID=A0AAV9A2L8_ACOGR|nr:Transcription factor LHW [Acorus gramineus]